MMTQVALMGPRVSLYSLLLLNSIINNLENKINPFLLRKFHLTILSISYSIQFADDDEIDEIYDNYEGQGDIKFQLGQPSIKTTSRKIGDQAMWDLFEVNSKDNI